MTQQQTKQYKDQFEKDGYIHIKKLFTEEEVNILNDAYWEVWKELMAKGKVIQAPNRPFDSLFPRLRDYHFENEAILDFIFNQKAIDILEGMIQEEIIAIQTSYYFKAPGAKGLPLHQDNYSLGATPDTSYAIWVSLDPSGKDNGGLVVVPGSHTFAIQQPDVVPESVNVYGKQIPVPSGYEAQEIETEVGDVVIFNGNILHGSTDNDSKTKFRRAIVTHYARESVEKITLNYNYLMDKNRQKTRRRLNANPRVVETKENLFEFHEAKYYDQIINRD
ncbi:phytanoyl-CoA dioxygenase family protein [Longirhabdus pacifica]|uniref:phytanoyl-CoA dioxygenase family protein n=1 Tax=Longirhabdus pacifica TaxID=2305227 RepID=UPI0010093C08|nr:phytanoyl-CoA dioxygenase family protein [Longirhabdus pacifica]